MFAWIRPIMLVAGGLTLLALLVFQMLVGLRKIKFEGPLHRKVHKSGAWTLLVFALFHGTMAAGYLLGW